MAGGEKVNLTLSWPHSSLSPNSRTHWARKARHQKEQRREWLLMAKDWQATHAPLYPSGAVWVTLYFVPPDRRGRDIDNLLASCKGGLDGLADALGVNDNRFKIAFEMAEETTKGGCVKVQVSAK